MNPEMQRARIAGHRAAKSIREALRTQAECEGTYEDPGELKAARAAITLADKHIEMATKRLVAASIVLEPLIIASAPDYMADAMRAHLVRARAELDGDFLLRTVESV
jgi:hypothetical protein